MVGLLAYFSNTDDLVDHPIAHTNDNITTKRIRRPHN